ncbi:MAG: AlpA family phage regulatory protein [Rhodanobacteraceae bacterium]|jgi:prophage regulatory protein|nr:AlpA family phage regulatory protein [Rhodanobacteraceae bacterium]
MQRERYESLLRMPEVVRRIGLQPAHVYALEARGDFPRRVKLGPRASAWVESEVSAWIESRIAARDARRAA